KQGHSRSFVKEPRGQPSNHRRSSAGFCGLWCAVPESGPAIWRAPAPWSPYSGNADELELDVKRLAIKRLHDVFVSTGFESRADMRHVVFGCAKDDLGLVLMPALAQELQKLHPAHHGHVPVEQDDIRHFRFTAGERFLAVAGFLHLKFEG